jgi:Icc-related predicted phosphoesterase
MTQPIRIAAVGDIHCSKANREELRELFAQMSQEADVIALCGDLTDHGMAEEAAVLGDVARTVNKPVVGVLGNHDYEGSQEDEIKRLLAQANVAILDGDIFVVKGVGFAGVKGFGGGFGKHELPMWGEQMIKNFVREAIEEEVKLERALARLDEPRVVLTHYAPIRATVDGESPEIFPFLGSGRLEVPINRFSVVAAFHGHAHHGSPRGLTSQNIPVYNVSIPVLHKAYPNAPPFLVVDIDPAVAQSGMKIH